MFKKIMQNFGLIAFYQKIANDINLSTIFSKIVLRTYVSPLHFIMFENLY